MFRQRASLAGFPEPSPGTGRAKDVARRGLGAIIVALLACTPEPPRLVTPGEVHVHTAWSSEERQRPTAVRSLAVSEAESLVVLRATESERPHVHDRSSLTIIVRSGRTRIHFADREIDLRIGDVLHIPRGTMHWLELVDGRPAEAYVLFSPAFDPNDRRFVDPGP